MLLSVAAIYFAIRLYILPDIFESKIYTFESSTGSSISVENRHPDLSYELDEDMLGAYLTMLGIKSDDMMQRFGERMKTIHVIIDNKTYEERQTIDPNSGNIYVSSEVVQKSGDLSIYIGLGNSVVVPEVVVDLDRYMNMIINMSIFNGVYFNASEEMIQSSISSLKRGNMDITLPAAEYQLIIFKNIEIK